MKTSSYLIHFSIIIFAKIIVCCASTKCPDFCDCDYFQLLKRAICRNKKLVSLELDIPKQAEILDVSFNHIRGLDEQIFMITDLTNLQLLNISHNKINHIHFKGFEGLNDLKTLDLSYNALEYFTKSWFVNLPQLEELYLRGNKLKDINNQPPINIPTLKVLDISDCGIISLKSDIFTNIPNLNHLDISDNYLRNLEPNMLQPLKNLSNFKARNNEFYCNEPDFIQLVKYTSKNSIQFSHDCPAVVMFERMILHDENSSMEIPGENPKEIKKNSWIYEVQRNEDDILATDRQKNGTNTERVPMNLFMQLIHSHPIIAICITFIYGFFSGMVAINYCNCYLWQKPLRSSSPLNTSNTTSTSRRRKKSSIHSRASLFNSDTVRRPFDSDTSNESLIMNEFFNPNSTPMTERRFLA